MRAGALPTGVDHLPESAWVVALAELPDMWASRLAALLGLRRGRRRPDDLPAQRPADVWRALLAGELGPGEPRLARRCQPDPEAVLTAWRTAAQTTLPAERWRAYGTVNVGVQLLGWRGYPSALAQDPVAPYVLFARGDIDVLDRPRVAIVGTRTCTATGRDIAFQFGLELAEAGVGVISGLALGIDGAAHAGALESSGAPPIGVVAGGLDRPYPARHRGLWHEVASKGVLLSEAPLGTANEAWRFPARNRVLAALADVVVVIESHARGGSMITADEALKRGKPVLAVPGPIRSPASAGTNRLFRDGAGPACDTADVLAALALERADAQLSRSGPPVSSGSVGRDRGQRQTLSPTQSNVLDAVDWMPTTTETVLQRTLLPPSEVAALLVGLEMDGRVRGDAGWWERCAVDSPPPGRGGHTVGR